MYSLALSFEIMIGGFIGGGAYNSRQKLFLSYVIKQKIQTVMSGFVLKYVGLNIKIQNLP